METTEVAPRIVFATGCFDLFHLGHLQFLEQARSLGDRLIVGVNTDERIIAYKGEPPIYPLHHRLRMVAALSCVDVAVPIDGLRDETGVVLMGVTHRAIAPGHMDMEHHRNIREKMEAAGIEYIMVPRTPGISTSIIKERCYEEVAGRGNMSGHCDRSTLGNGTDEGGTGGAAGLRQDSDGGGE